MKCVSRYFLLLILANSILTFAKSESGLTLFWPNQTNPLLRITFGRFDKIGEYAGQMSLVSQVIVENTSGKALPQASFTVYLHDKKNVRVGEGVLHISDLGPTQQAKVAFQVSSVGIPSTLELLARKDSSGAPVSVKTIPLKIISVPPQAKLKVDGEDAGTTPITVRLSVGTHQLEMTKEGYAPGTTPVDVTADELPGGSITVELGGLSRDTLELRDGTIVLGDVTSMSMTQVVVRVEGNDRIIDRNQVKKMMLVERVITQQHQ